MYPPGSGMTSAEPDLNVLALNSGSSSLKFGLYRVGSSQIRNAALRRGRVDRRGKNGKFSRTGLATRTFLSPRRHPFPANGKPSSASQAFLPTPKCRRRTPSGIASCMADRSFGSIASSTTRSCGSSKPPPPSRRCILHRLCRSSASHRSIFPRLPQAACFDTTFHAGLPEVARVLPIAQGTAIGGYPALRVSRPFLRVDRAPACERSAGPPDHRPSRQRRERHRGQGRQIDRHQHGIDPDRRGDHGHAQRRSRSGRSDLPDAREEVRCGHARRAGRPPFRPAGDFGSQQRHAASA